MDYSSNYDKLCGYFTLSSPDNLNPLRRTGPGFGSILYFSNALVTYYNNENFRQNRFNSTVPNVPFQSNYTFSISSNANINSNIYFTLSNLMPNMQYSFKVSVKNTCNPENGFFSSNSDFITTPLPPPPPQLNSVTVYTGCNLFSAPTDTDEYYNNEGQTISIPRQFIGKILKYAVYNRPDYENSGILNIINGGGPLAILNNYNPSGQGIQSQLYVTCGSDINYFGIPGQLPGLYGFAGTLQSPGTCNTLNSVISIGGFQDTYANIPNLDRFYVQCSNIQIRITKNFLQPSCNGYTYTITHSNNGRPDITTCNFGPFYVDSLMGSPSLDSYTSFNDHRQQSSFVSGILVNSNSNSYQFYFDCFNLGNNFLAYNNFASYKIIDKINNSDLTNQITISRDSPIYTINCNIISNAPLPTIIRLSNTSPISLNISENIILHTSNTNTLFRLRITLTNILRQNLINTDLYYYYDTLSLRTLRINFSDSFARGGMRIESFSNSCNNTVRTYNQSTFIVGSSCNLYNFELPLVGGFYRTGGNLGNVFAILADFKQPGGFESYTYPTNYTSLRTESGYRVATFKYSFLNSSAGSISALQFNINSNSPFRFTSEACNFDTNQVPFLRYKVDNIGIYNTGWLDGNSVKADSAPFSSGNATDGQAGLLINPTQYPINITSRYWSIIPIPTNCNYDVYVKIGLNMSCNLFFDYIYLSNAFGIKPLAPTNITFTVFTTPTGMILNWVNAYNTGDPPVLNNGISVRNITDPYYPRRWVPSGPAASNDTYSATIASNTSNVFSLVNADTTYQANISNENTGGYGPVGTAIGKTDLPIQTLGGFNDSSFSFTNYYNSTVNPYYANCNGYSFVDRAVASNIFYTANLFLVDTDYLQVNMSPTFIVNTSNSILTSNYPGIYLSNFTFSGYGSNNSVITESSYQFINSLYSNVSLTSDSGIDNSGVTLMLSNMGDIYTDHNYFSGYFYKSALGLKLYNSYLVPSNKPYSVGFVNNYSSDILNPAPIWVDDFQSNLLPTVENMFVDSNNLAALDGNGVPIRFTYSTGVLIFSSRFNPFTIQSNTTYNFWLHAKNIGLNFFVNSPYQFSLSQTGGSSNFSFNPATTIFYNSPAFGDILTSSAQNASSDTFFLFSNVQMKFTNSNVFSPLSDTSIDMSGSVTNQNGSSLVTSTVLRGINSNDLFFDDASLNVLYLTQSAFSSIYLNAPGPNNNYGYRVTSGAGDYPGIGDFGELFNNCNSLISGIYENELQLTDGSFVPKGFNSFLDYTIYYNPIPSTYSYPDYTTIANDSTMRYATFMWHVSYDSLGGNEASIGHFNIANNNFTTTNNEFGFPVLNNVTTQFMLNNSTGDSTGWLDANSWTEYQRTFSPTNGQARGLNDSTANSFNRYVLFLDESYFGLPPFILYFRIGIPLNSGLFFSGCQLVNIST